MKKFVAVAVVLIAAVVVLLAQEKKAVDFPKIVSVKQMLSEPVPAGSCKVDDDRAGFLFAYQGKVEAAYMAGGLRDEYRPSKEQIGSFVSEKMSQGYVVALYPQSDGWIFVDTQCSPGLEALLEKAK
jgi:hypothetical protein